MTKSTLLLFGILSLFINQQIKAQSYNYSYTSGNLGTKYSWIDCSPSSGGHEINDNAWLQNKGLGDKKDDGYAKISWPFAFQFYDSYYFAGDDMYVCTNGFIRFDGIPDDDATDTYNNTINNYSPNLGEIVSLAMEDCGVESVHSHVYYRTTGSAPNRIFTVSMDSLEIRYNQNKYTDVQVSFYETSNVVVLKLGFYNINVSAYMGIHSGNSSYKNQWQNINGATAYRWRAYVPPAKSSPSFTTTQATTDNIYPSINNKLLRIQVDVNGGSGDFDLTSLDVTANNTANSDVGNVKLFHTSSPVFSTAHQIGNAVTISGGKYKFANLNYNMPGGTTYIWVAYDINSGAVNGNTVDGYIAANAITINGNTYPASSQNPNGNRKISYFQWDGSSSTNWTVASNWSNNSVPTRSDNVIIPSGPTNQPRLPNNKNGYCKNIEIQSGATLTVENSNRNMRIYGNILNNGTIDVTGTYNILLYGTDNTIDGTGNFNTCRFRLRGSGVKYTLLDNLNIKKFSLDDNTTLNVNDKNLVCSSIFKDVGSSSVVNITTGSIAAAGTVTLSGTLNAGTGTFYYSGGNGQAIIDKTYYNLKIRLSSGNRTLTNVGSNFQNLELTNLSTSTGTAKLSAALNFDGNIDIGPYCKLDLNGKDVNIGKNWYNNGSVTLGTNTIIFDGIGSSHIYGNTSFYNLTINKSYGDIYIETTTHVTNTLALTKGIVFTTTSSPLIVDAGSNTTGGGNASYVNGPLRKDGNTAYKFHVGAFRKYAPIEMSAPASNTQFTAQYHNDKQSNTSSLLSPLAKVSQKEYWDFNRVGSSSSVNLTLYWLDGTFSGIQTLADLRIAHFNGSAWENLGNTATSGNASSGTIRVNGVSNFSPFTFGTIDNTSNTLPIELKSFDLSKVSNGVRLDWITATEKNNDFFSIERTLDGEHVETIARVKGAGNSNAIRAYSFIDTNPPIGMVYYRIRQTDFDGKTEVFNWKNIRINPAYDFKLYPNPSSENIIHIKYGDYSGIARIQIYSIAGSLISDNRLSFSQGSGQLQHSLKAGYYLLIVTIDNVTYSSKLIVQ